MRVPRSMSRKLGYYVYLLVDPRNDSVFYVGKGKGNRALSHLTSTRETRRAKIIKEIRARKQEPRIEILAHALDVQTAFRIESAAIDLIGVSKLANEQRGWGSAKAGRMPIEQPRAIYAEKRIEVRRPAILIRINRLYRYGMADNELYDATRGSWRIDPRRAGRAQYAFAVYGGVVREVYAISKWLPAGSTYSAQDPHGVKIRDRWEFVGTLADGGIVNRCGNGLKRRPPSW